MYERPYPSSEVLVGAHSVAIEEISIREIEETELPARLRDPERLIEPILRDIKKGTGSWKLKKGR